jgi:hypothetical protein
MIAVWMKTFASRKESHTPSLAPAVHRDRILLATKTGYGAITGPNNSAMTGRSQQHSTLFATELQHPLLNLFSAPGYPGSQNPIESHLLKKVEPLHLHSCSAKQCTQDVPRMALPMGGLMMINAQKKQATPLTAACKLVQPLQVVACKANAVSMGRFRIVSPKSSYL